MDEDIGKTDNGSSSLSVQKDVRFNDFFFARLFDSIRNLFQGGIQCSSRLWRYCEPNRLFLEILSFYFIYKAVIENEFNRPYVMLLRELKLQGEVLEKAVRQRETLLSEIHYRVKNNFSIVSSVIRLQSSKLGNENDALLFMAITVKIRLTVEEKKSVMLAINRAIPCGLIINDLFTNSVKDAFHGERKGAIEVTVDLMAMNSSD
jgi:hypothetical protein